MVDDGVIKFSFSEFVKTEAIPNDEFSSIETFRKKLFKLNLIGEYLPEKIGFGNISVRHDYSDLKKTNFPQFLITGTQTGCFEELRGEHYTRVTDGCLEKQTIGCHGPLQASSESLTHGAIYMASNEIKAIVHVHHRELWKLMLERDYARTSKSISYGTPEMATEAIKLIEGKTKGCFVMEGHQDGVVFYGKSIEEAAELTLETYFFLLSD